MDESEPNSQEEVFFDGYYEKNLETLEKLQDQRIQITKYISDLAKLKLRIDVDPLRVAKECLSLETSGPTSIENIAKIPVDPGLFYNDLNFQNYNTRKVTVNTWKELKPKPSPTPIKTPNDEGKIRGRPCDETKPASFNKLWSTEEQMLFEQLLDVYPFEKSESARCRKIAEAMGTRTPRQVRSRMQKYYMKLKVFDKYQHSSVMSEMKACDKRLVNQRYTISKKAFRKSTFLPRYNVSEPISNDEVNISPCSEISAPQEEMDPDMKSEIMIQLEAFRLQDSEELSAEHLGYKCVVCDEEPIVGPRWHCVLCVQRTDLCCSCMREYVKMPLIFTSEQHNVTHPFEVIIAPSTFNDPDYLLDKFDSNNYLDPNFLPE